MNLYLVLEKIQSHTKEFQEGEFLSLFQEWWVQEHFVQESFLKMEWIFTDYSRENLQFYHRTLTELINLKINYS